MKKKETVILMRQRKHRFCLSGKRKLENEEYFKHVYTQTDWA